MKKLFIWWFKFKGWRFEGGIPDGVKKCVLIGAPHTSNWDFIYGVASLAIANVPLKLLIKKDLFFWPLGSLLKYFGGIPVERSKNTGMVESMVQLLNKSDELILLMTPEGTRSYVQNWKKGFYYTALNANVPIVLGNIDYNKKITKIDKVFLPTGNVDEDIESMKNYYRNYAGRYPEKGIK